MAATALTENDKCMDGELLISIAFSKIFLCKDFFMLAMKFLVAVKDPRDEKSHLAASDHSKDSRAKNHITDDWI